MKNPHDKQSSHHKVWEEGYKGAIADFIDSLNLVDVLDMVDSCSCEMCSEKLRTALKEETI